MKKRVPILFSMCHWHILDFFKRWKIDRDSMVLKIPRPPDVPAHLRFGVQFGGLKIFLGQIFYQAQIPISIVLELGSDINLVASRVCINVISFPVPPGRRHLVGWERLKMLLLLRRRRNDGRETCR